MAIVAKKLKYAPFQTSLAAIFKEIEPSKLSSENVDQFFVYKEGLYGSYKIYKVHSAESSGSTVMAELVYSPEEGAVVGEPAVKMYIPSLVWLVPAHTQKNIQKLRDYLLNFSKNDPQTLYEIRECLKVLKWEHHTGVHDDTLEPFLVYNSGYAPASAVGKHIYLEMFSDPDLLKATLRYLQSAVAQNLQVPLCLQPI